MTKTMLAYNIQFNPYQFNIIVLLFLMLITKSYANGSHQGASDGQKWQCEPIRFDLCKNIRYNLTTTYHNNNQEHVESFNLVVQTKCSKHFRLFLCSLSFPLCNHQANKPITACRSLCEEVKRNCINTLKRIGHIPEALNNCSRFTENREGQMCLDGGIKKTPQKTTQTPTKTKKRTQTQDRKSTIGIHSAERQIRTAKIASGITFCKVLYAKNNRNYFYVEKFKACALGCMKDGLFTYTEKQLAEKWLLVLACLCVLSCVLSLVAVIIDYHKTSYPERTIIFIVACYLLYALAYVIRLVYSREGVSCQEEGGYRYLLVDGTGNITCVATFLLVFCFSLAQNIWWIMLCLTWFLSAGLRWSSQTIKSKSSYFHVVAWGVPCVIAVVALVLRKIDVNELTGICSIGNRYENLTELRSFVLGPSFTFLVMGLMFLLFGFIALLRIPGHMNEKVTSWSSLKQPLAPVAIYAALHTFFSTFILASYFYEYVNKTAWYYDPTSAGPSFVVFLVRIIMDFLIGLCAALWLLCVHTPPLFEKLKLKLFKSHIIIDTTPEHAVLDPLRSQTGTNETSI